MLEGISRPPWTVAAAYKGTIAIVSDGPFNEACVIAGACNRPNAHLMAAAPDLYEALSALLEHAGGSIPLDVLTRVDEALEKANGRTAQLEEQS